MTKKGGRAWGLALDRKLICSAVAECQTGEVKNIGRLSQFWRLRSSRSNAKGISEVGTGLSFQDGVLNTVSSRGCCVPTRQRRKDERHELALSFYKIQEISTWSWRGGSVSNTAVQA